MNMCLIITFSPFQAFSAFAESQSDTVNSTEPSVDDWSINEPDEPGSGKLRGSSYTLTDNSVFNYWARLNEGETAEISKLYNKEPLYKKENHLLYQDSIDQIKAELCAGHGVSTGLTLTNEFINHDTWAVYDRATRPDDGELVATATRVFETQGYHRTALDAPVSLNAGDRLGIVVQQSRTFDDGITRYSVDAQEADGYRERHRDPVYGTPVLNQGESFWKCDGLTDLEEASQEGWFDMTAPLSVEMLLYLKPDAAKNKNLLDFYKKNYVGKPFREFFNIDNFCIKAFGEPSTPDQVCPKDDTCPMTLFTDTDKNAWYHDGVHWALQNEVMNGTGKTTFAPNESTTRAMLVTVRAQVATMLMRFSEKVS